MADVTTTGPGLAKRQRARAEQRAGAEYRTFPARVPAVLSALAGGFGVLGALGAGVRATAVEVARDEPKQVAVLMGHRSAAGWVLTVLALLLVASALAWIGNRRRAKLGAASVAVAFVVVAALRLSFFDRRSSELADVAVRNPQFAGFHAGLGWGAWLLLGAAVLAGFALLVAALRALDRRKGIPG